MASIFSPNDSQVVRARQFDLQNQLPADKTWRRRTLPCGCVLGEFSVHVKWCDKHWKEARAIIMNDERIP